MKKLILFSFMMASLFFAGCASRSIDDDDDELLITQPVTNNPLLIPNHDSPIPGLPSMPGGHKPGGR